MLRKSDTRRDVTEMLGLCRDRPTAPEVTSVKRPARSIAIYLPGVVTMYEKMTSFNMGGWWFYLASDQTGNSKKIANSPHTTLA